MVSLRERFRAQYGDNGIYAGGTHFRAYWSRDALFACFGALALGDTTIVKKTLDTFLLHEQNGHIPLRVGYKSQIMQYLRLPAGSGPTYHQDKGWNAAVDSNALFLIVAHAYERQTKTTTFDREKLRKVIAWLIEHERNGVLHQGPYADWEDSLKFTGARLYSNVCYIRALRAAAKLFKDTAYNKRADAVTKQVRQWWNGEYFTDGPTRDVCFTAGNLLAIVWNIASRAQATNILAYLADRPSVCPPASFATPRRRDTHLSLILINLHDYHGLLEWSWLTGLEIAAYRAVGNHREADKRWTVFQLLIEAWNGCYEIYEHDKPLKRLIYRSENNFSWGMGIAIASQPLTWSILQ